MDKILERIKEFYRITEHKTAQGQIAYLIHTENYCEDGDEYCVYVYEKDNQIYLTDFSWLVGKLMDWNYDKYIDEIVDYLLFNSTMLDYENGEFYTVVSGKHSVWLKIQWMCEAFQEALRLSNILSKNDKDLSDSFQNGNSQ